MRDVCGVCKGNKCSPGTHPSRCQTCHGSGTVNFRQGPMQIQMDCNSCDGKGSSIKNPCHNCKGHGEAHKTQKETIKIPQGISNGQNLRVSMKGNQGRNGGRSGDLIIKIKVKNDSYFRREGYNIYTEIPLNISQAVLGAELEVKTLIGKRKIHIKPGTAHGDQLRIPNAGVSKLPPNQNQKGSHFLIFKV